MSSPQNTTSPLRLLVAWLVVGLPLAWGVWNTLQKALQLFIAK